MSSPRHTLVRLLIRAIRRYLVGPEQRWVFESLVPDWRPLPVKRTSLYLHVPFCRHFCPYCPYTKVPYNESLLEPYTRAATAEVDWWAERVGPAEVTSIYIGGGTPTLALDSVAAILKRMRERFRLNGDICIETNPADVNIGTVKRLQDMNITLVSLGVESFQAANLATIGRGYPPVVAEQALALLAGSGFASVNADIMFALPGQTTGDVTADLDHAAHLGANQLTTYPLFTFPYTSVGKYLKIKEVHMPNLYTRHAHYLAINHWCREHGYERVSVWGFKQDAVPCYSSVTRDGYIGIGPGAGSHLLDGFVLNTFDLPSYIQAACSGCRTTSLRMPFVNEMAGWWWLYWRFYDTRISLDHLNEMLGADSAKARQLLRAIQKMGFAVQNGDQLELTEAGAFWLHLMQNYFALNYVNTLWTQARKEPWPQRVAI